MDKYDIALAAWRKREKRLLEKARRRRAKWKPKPLPKFVWFSDLRGILYGM